MREDVICRVREHRTEHGMTQEQLARMVGVSRQSIISIEKGQYIPSLPLALRLANAFNCRVEDLFTLREES